MFVAIKNKMNRLNRANKLLFAIMSMNNPFKEYAVSFVINEDHFVANDNASKCNGGQNTLTIL